MQTFCLNAKACLNFVKNQHNVVFFSHFADFFQPFGWRCYHTAFTLNCFKNDSLGLVTPLSSSMKFSKKYVKASTRFTA
jgi:uncharacterized protein (DUF2132 family)